MIRFARYRLRTTDVAAAREFYGALLGADSLDVVALPPEAIARGARPHWLGHLAVDDVEAMVQAFVARGAMQLGPLRANEHDGVVAIVRDPGGAIVAFESRGEACVGPRVVWHGLNTNDEARAVEHHRELFGWHFFAPAEIESVGRVHPFAWTADGRPIGSIAGIEKRPDVHPHWLFHFEVPSLDRAIATARERGGLVLGPFVSPSGDRIAVCDDPQGAAFAIRSAVQLAST